MTKKTAPEGKIRESKPVGGKTADWKKHPAIGMWKNRNEPTEEMMARLRGKRD
jgi:hypothetical protein